MGDSYTWRRPLSDAIIKACGRFTPDQIFEAVVDGALIRLGVNAAEPVGEDLERIAGPLREQLADTVLHSPPFADILGEAYMALRSNGKAKQLGQWFTPQPVAMAMNEIMMADVMAHEPTDQDRLLSMCDPCCGSGVQLLSAAAALHGHAGPAVLRRWSFTGIDLDNLCAKMTALAMLANCALHDLPVGELVVYRGNSLMPAACWRVIVHATAPDAPITRVAPALHPVRTKAIREAAATMGEQLSLFS